MKWHLAVPAFVVALSVAWAGVGAATSFSDSLILEVRLSSREFVVGQPMPYLVILWNKASRPLADVAPLGLESQFVVLDMEDASGGAVPGPRLRATTDASYPWGGITLPAGRALCEGGDLFHAIGTEAPGSGRLSSLVGKRALAPGSYRVRARFEVHTRHSESDEAGPASLVSAWQSLRIDSIGMDDRNALEQLWIDAGSPTLGSDGKLTPKIRMRTRERANGSICPKLGELARSRFFHVAYSLVSCERPDGPDLGLVDTLRRVPTQEVEAAWILAREISRVRWPDARKRAWVANALRTRQDPLQGAVLDSWLLKLDQRKFYVSFDQ